MLFTLKKKIENNIGTYTHLPEAVDDVCIR